MRFDAVLVGVPSVSPGASPLAPMSAPRGIGRGRSGFTLVEILVVLVLSGLLGATMIKLVRVQNGSFRRQNSSAEAEQALRGGLDLMVRELRNAGTRERTSTYGAGLPGIARADSDAVRVKQDIHGAQGPDGDVSDPNEDIEYTLSSADSTLRRTDRGAGPDSTAQPMTPFVTRLRFDYYDAAGTAIPFPIAGADLGRIRRVQIMLTGAAKGWASPRTFQADVAPPNLAY